MRHFQWAVLLLVIAVLLPTVCLLWLMGHAVENERLAIRQKLVDSYRLVLSDQLRSTDQEWIERIRQTEILLSGPPPHMLPVLVENGLADGLLVYDRESNELLYPVVGEKAAAPDWSETFRTASQLEFLRADLEGAIAAYTRIAARQDDSEIQLRAAASVIRCLKKANRFDEAVAASKVLLEKNEEPQSVESARLLFNIRLGLLQLMQQTGSPDFEEELRALAAQMMNPLSFPVEMPADVRGAVKQQMLSWVDALPESFEYASIFQQARALLAAEQRSLDASEQQVGLFQSPKKISRLPGEPPVFSYSLHAEQTTYVILLSQEKMTAFFEGALGDFFSSDVCVRIQDPERRLIYSTQAVERAELVRLPLSEYFMGWTITLCPSDDGFFNDAASKQAVLYIWTGTLVILLFLAAGAAAVILVSRQAKLNRMKNDFIATVSHELKTPLASMRVLMDTLFEGHYELPEQVEEYLKMISQDNMRLSRLIDGFLTFSRMERNKCAFTLTGETVEPIVQAAVDAMRTKLDQNDCTFTLQLPGSLPLILADGDALALTLINLLENAYKYSEPPRSIGLTVMQDGQEMVFKVTDHGIGMTPRAVRRIFDKFYQVDQRLVRNVDGCGLGLSIVKYIVDAHSGSIHVDSRLNEGSTFVVRIPLA
ncbi:HAMP domain-containing sensor histidine kinase [Pontiellaceae bacterium B1224]|nr:HAMP domain-containing sensor histidine kinase [Pontiellaceae bacterium B1224]